MSTELDTDESLLLDFDIELECEHSRHNEASDDIHSGKAEFYCKLIANCCADIPKNLIYASCARWALYVTMNRDNLMMCTYCGFVSQVKDHVIVLGRIK